MKTAINSENAPSAIGTYPQAIRANNWVFLSGQIPLTTSGEVLSGCDEKAIGQVFSNLRAVAQAAGGDLNNIVKLTVYLTNLSDFGKVNDVMKNLFSEPYPARAVVEVSGLPREACIEADAIMLIE